MLQLYLVFVVSLSDSFLAGRFVPDSGGHVAAQSALTTASYLTWLLSGYMVFVTVGSTALVSRFVGANKLTRANRVANQSIILALFFGIPAAVIGIVGRPWLLTALQINPDAQGFASDYLLPLFLALPLQMIMQAGIASLVGAGDTRTGMWVLVFVALVNVPFSWAFFHGWFIFPKLSFPGIGYGTAVSHAMGSLIVFLVLLRGRAGLKIHGHMLRPNRGLLLRMLKVSVPAGLDSLILMIGQLWFLSIVNRLSKAESAAHGIALRCEGISYLSGVAFATAAMTLVGQNLGAKRPQDASRSAWNALAMACGLMSLMGVIFFVLAPQLFELFCPHEHQASVVVAGIPALRLIALAMPPLAVCIVFTQALRGAGDTRVPVLITVIGFFLIRAPIAIYLTQPEMGLGLFGAWLAMCADIFVRGGFFLWRFLSGRWKTIEV